MRFVIKKLAQNGRDLGALKALPALLIFTLTLLAGALTLEISDPAANSEATAKHAVVVARTTACRSPEKTELIATAEGLTNGVRQTIPLKVIPLSTPGTFAVTREWPSAGTWAVRLVAKNPDYHNYATGVLVPFKGSSVEWASIQHYFHEPTAGELAAVLGSRLDGARASVAAH